VDAYDGGGGINGGHLAGVDAAVDVVLGVEAATAAATTPAAALVFTASMYDGGDTETPPLGVAAPTTTAAAASA
jgi:hypothetical protein